MPSMFGRRETITATVIVALATAAGAAMLASSACAGFAADPRIGDVQLGKKYGIAYVKDAEKVVDSGSTVAPTGCPGKGQAWRVAGGGFSAGRPFNYINASRPLDHTDADQKADDYWQVESYSAGVGTKITGYAICMKEPKLRYASATAPDSPDEDRTLSVDCPGKSKPVGGGASISHSDSFLSSLYPSGRSWNAAVHDFDGGTGNFTADAVCLKSRNIETVRTSRIIDPVTQGNVKILAEAPAMPMSTLYQTHGPSIGPGIPSQPVFKSVPFDGRDRDRIPDDGWEVGISNTSSQSLRVTFYSTYYTPPRP
jgi:hypothetical protein